MRLSLTSRRVYLPRQFARFRPFDALGNVSRVAPMVRNVSPAPLPHDTAATSIAEDDFNGDGIVDVATVAASSNMVQVYFMSADGTPSQPTQYPVGSQPLSVITADFNHDNQPDLAVTNIGDNTVSVLLGKNDGIFRSAMTYPAGGAPWSLATADFNGDGIPDLVVTDCGDLDFGLAKLNSGAKFGASGTSELVSKAEPMTDSGSILGTLHYMSSEQPPRTAPAWRAEWPCGKVTCGELLDDVLSHTAIAEREGNHSFP